MSKINRKFLNEKGRAKFKNLTSGEEGQMSVRRNSKGDVELVAFFGGKWYYCPMAEFNKSINARSGLQINGEDVMTAGQKGSSGFTGLRLDTASKESAPRKYETIVFVDNVPATASTGAIVVTFGASSTELTYVSGDCTRLKLGLNVLNVGNSAAFVTNVFITNLLKSDNSTWVHGTDSDGDLVKILISSPTLTAHSGSNDNIVASTRDTNEPNAFFNILYRDGSGSTYFYHKFQLNNNDVPGLATTFNQNIRAGYTSGAGGTGTSTSIPGGGGAAADNPG